ncbi:SOUL family heme-binding protein [Candidatus Halobonum tyrrellensis]|uniref:SOUL heme-binding protein n=1 Tax=Candidatus Halobonum tyrrellensis G22 TaxID=1324957 RepID=V4HHF1_9EURY|nr:heme-binding protein [Candidatus Halobonum tyrrellensis]ESP90200.1 SOUL heme-binding protein [Candidatus Halobonum tyrrellensis G22]
MIRTRTLLAGGTLALAGASVYRTYRDRTTERVPYDVLDRFGPVELRAYPPSVLVETTAASDGEAFRRLFGYLSGENRDAERVGTTAPAASDGTEIPMTAPVETGAADPDGDDRGAGASVPMTAPVETGAADPDGTDSGVRMAFYLPVEYDVHTAPRPTDPAVELVAVPARTLAALRFSWWPTDRRVRRYRRRLLATLREAGVETTGDPFTLGYEGPGTLPFLRRNEVVVAVRTPE